MTLVTSCSWTQNHWLEGQCSRLLLMLFLCLESYNFYDNPCKCVHIKAHACPVADLVFSYLLYVRLFYRITYKLMFGYYKLNQICYLHMAFTEFIQKHPYTAVKLCIPLHNEKIKPCSIKGYEIQPLMKDS